MTFAYTLPEFVQYNYLTYLIVPASELIYVDFNQLVSEHPSVSRTAVGEGQTIIKWLGPEPDFVQLIAGANGPYDHEGIHQVIDSLEWHKHYSETYHPEKVLPANWV